MEVYESTSTVNGLGVGINVLPRAYKRTAGFDPETLNARSSLSVR